MENMEQPIELTGHNAEVLRNLCRPHGEQGVFSLLDLIECETIGIDLAAWLVSHISRGASLITASGPGGVGKSTMMRALLGFAPDERHFTIALPGRITAAPGCSQCIISHELSDHPPPTYLWGDDLRAFFGLSASGHMLVGNMHANDLTEAHSQVVEANGVPEVHFSAVDLFLFMRIEGEDAEAYRLDGSTGRRYVDKVYHSLRGGAHVLIYRHDRGLSAAAPRDPAHEARCRRFIEEALNRTERSIEELRNTFLSG